MARLTATQQLEYEIRALQEFIEATGGLSGYVQRYGVKGEPNCRGEGGEAIFRADTDALFDLKEKLAKKQKRARR
jgi:hypothetical protein